MTSPILIAGPCAVENEDSLSCTADSLHKLLVAQNRKLHYFRAGIWKPRSMPKAFSGVGEKGLPWLQTIQKKYETPVCVEVNSPEQIDLCENFDIKAIWIGARTSVNPIDVQNIADACKGRNFTVMVKNPMVADLRLWIGNIDRFLSDSTCKVMAIHRGFADSNESVYRNRPNWEIAIDLKVHYPTLPVICDPSHIAGQRNYIAQLSQLAIDYGFDGLMIETHYKPESALSDSNQQLTPDAYAMMLNQLHFKSSPSSPAENELRKQRTLINNIDTQLSVLLQKRMSIVDAISQIKKEHNLPVVQPEQWKKVVSLYQENSIKDDEYQEFINQFLELLHLSSIKRQRK